MWQNATACIWTSQLQQLIKTSLHYLLTLWYSVTSAKNGPGRDAQRIPPMQQQTLFSLTFAKLSGCSI